MDKTAEGRNGVKETKTVVSVTNGRVAHPKRWIAVLVQMNCEKKAAARLDKLGVKNYLPIQKEVHQWSDRKKKIDRVVIPMVLFVHVYPHEDYWLLRQSFIYKLVALPGSEECKRNQATPIPDKQILRLKRMLDDADSEVIFVETMKPGDMVCVVEGPLKGLEGIVNQADEDSSIVGVEIKGFGYACVKIAKRYLMLNR